MREVGRAYSRLLPRCRDVGSRGTLHSLSMGQPELPQSPQACKEAPAIWFSGSWAFRHCWMPRKS